MSTLEHAVPSRSGWGGGRGPGCRLVMVLWLVVLVAMPRQGAGNRDFGMVLVMGAVGLGRCVLVCVEFSIKVILF